MEWKEQFFKDEAQRLWEELEGGTLFGEPFDWDSLGRDALMVAAYHAGEAAVRTQNAHTEKLMRELRGV